jgi:hypothetical protein
MHIILRAEIIVLGHQISEIERELVLLQLAEAMFACDYTNARRALHGQHVNAVRMFDLASDHYQEVMNYC